MTTSSRERKRAYFAWAAVCLIWGTTYLALRICLESIPPALMGGMRWTIAGALLTLYLAARGQPLPSRRSWASIALLGFLLTGLGNGGVVFAEQWVPSGLTAVLVATAPFWMATVEAMLSDGERFRLNTLAGLTVGFSGIVLLVWPDLTLDSPGERPLLAGIIAAQIACAGWALGSSYSRRHRTENILGMTALQMLAGGLIMSAVGLIRGEWADLHFTARTAVALAYLTTLGAIGGMVAYTYALRHLPMSFVSLYAYINPIIAVTLGVLVLHEPFDSRMAAAAALVFAGVAIVRWNAPASPVPRPIDAADSDGLRSRTAGLT